MTCEEFRAIKRILFNQQQPGKVEPLTHCHSYKLNSTRDDDQRNRRIQLGTKQVWETSSGLEKTGKYRECEDVALAKREGTDNELLWRVEFLHHLVVTKDLK